MNIEDLLLEWFGPEEVHKSFNPVTKDFILTKAWEGENGALNIEGWISTNDQDQEKDITEPEAFQKSLESYFRRSAPVSFNHDTKSLPIGHLQKGALVRDGAIFHEARHPTDTAEFEHFPGTGTGFYARGVLTESTATSAVKKGNVGGFSFIGNATHYQKLPGGGRRFTEINPLIETTVAPYPVNTQAAILAAKAFGLEEGKHMSPEEFAQMIAKAVADAQTPPAVIPDPEPVQKAVSLDDVQKLLVASFAEFGKAIDAKIEKATTFSREGVGRAGTIAPAENSRDADPLGYIVKKAAGDPLSLDDVDRAMIGELTTRALKEGMLYE